MNDEVVRARGRVVRQTKRGICYTEEVTYFDNVLHGLTRSEYYRCRYEMPYVDGKRHGFSRAWHENGILWIEAPHLNGQQHGLVREWNTYGRLLEEKRYICGVEKYLLRFR